jgi:hypothetical protein
MDKNNGAVIALRLSRKAAGRIALIGIVGCLAITVVTAAVHGAGAAVGA